MVASLTFKKFISMFFLFFCVCVCVGFILFPVTVSHQLLLFLNKAFTKHHHPLLQVLGWTQCVCVCVC